MKIPVSPKPFDELLAAVMKKNRLFAVIKASAEPPLRKPEYVHWDELRHRTPPAGLSREEWWLALKLRRVSAMRPIPMRDKQGRAFNFSVPDPVVERLHFIERDAGVLISTPEPVTNAHTRDRYLVRSLIEEAITSSQLEGAATTREVAKAMLSSGRKPRDRSERMILNNYLTMQRIREVRNSPLTPTLVLELHRMLGDQALDKPEAAGRFRRSDEPIDVSDIEGTVFHLPPPAEELPARLDAMCRFANGETPDYFIHPVIRAILLHFWLAYDHPFVDGNGRTARGLFYWAMLNRGFWLFEFISVSQIILKAPAQYGRAFLCTETDANDLTYFLFHQTEVIRRAVKELHNYIARETREVEESRGLIDRLDWLNHRQQALLVHALKHPGQRYTLAGHRTRHGIAYATARTDLLKLAEHELLEQRTIGKEFVFRPPQDLLKRLKTDRLIQAHLAEYS